MSAITAAVASGQSTPEKKLIDRPMTTIAPTRSAAEPRTANNVSAKATIRRCVGPRRGDEFRTGGGGDSSNMEMIRAEIRTAFQPAITWCGWGVAVELY